MDKIKVLLVEDNIGDARLVKEMVKEVDSEIIINHVATLQDAISKLETEFFDAVLLDLNLPDSFGDLTFHKMKEYTTSTPIILLTGLNDELVAVNAVKKGAQDYLVKGQVTSGLLLRSLNYSIERNRLLKQLQSASLIDELTGLYNRRGFFELAQKQINIANRTKNGFLIVYCDLNDLKLINDNAGHQYGDQAITEATTVLKNTFRDSDIISRFGGDEFVILALNSSKNDIETIYSRIKQCVALSNENSKIPFGFTLSISTGIVYYDPNFPCDIEDLLCKADKLMYADKIAIKGKNNGTEL